MNLNQALNDVGAVVVAVQRKRAAINAALFVGGGLFGLVCFMAGVAYG